MDKYSLVEVIGKGSFGDVYRAIKKDTGEVYAIKAMKQQFATWDECMQLREVRSLCRLQNKNIIKLKEVLRVQTTVFLVFEHAEQDICHFYLNIKKQGNRLPESLVRSIFYQLTQALSYIHKHGYFHRDLKPENILYSASTGYLKLIDFGLAREIRSRPPFSEYVSTRWYRAPELLLRAQSYNSPVDIFALGCIMAELFMLKPIFDGQSEIDQLNKITRILGTPSKSDWIEGHKLASSIGITFMNSQGVTLNSIINENNCCFAPLDAVALISDCLKWDPSKRPTAMKILQHQYFKDVEGVLPRGYFSDESGNEREEKNGVVLVKEQIQQQQLQQKVIKKQQEYQQQQEEENENQLEISFGNDNKLKRKHENQQNNKRIENQYKGGTNVILPANITGVTGFESIQCHSESKIGDKNLNFGNNSDQQCELKLKKMHTQDSDHILELVYLPTQTSNNAQGFLANNTKIQQQQQQQQQQQSQASSKPPVYSQTFQQLQHPSQLNNIDFNPLNQFKTKQALTPSFSDSRNNQTSNNIDQQEKSHVHSFQQQYQKQQKEQEVNNKQKTNTSFHGSSSVNDQLPSRQNKQQQFPQELNNGLVNRFKQGESINQEFNIPQSLKSNNTTNYMWTTTTNNGNSNISSNYRQQESNRDSISAEKRPIVSNNNGNYGFKNNLNSSNFAMNNYPYNQGSIKQSNPLLVQPPSGGSIVPRNPSVVAKKEQPSSSQHSFHVSSSSGRESSMNKMNQNNQQDSQSQQSSYQISSWKQNTGNSSQQTHNLNSNNTNIPFQVNGQNNRNNYGNNNNIAHQKSFENQQSKNNQGIQIYQGDKNNLNHNIQVGSQNIYDFNNVITQSNQRNFNVMQQNNKKQQKY